MHLLRLSVPLLLLLFAGMGFSSTSAPEGFIAQSRKIPVSPFDAVPVSDENGGTETRRLEERAGDAIRLISGEKSLWGLHPLQLYLGLAIVPNTITVPILGLNDPTLKRELGLPRSRYRFSLAELEATTLERRALALPSKAKGSLAHAYLQLRTLREVIDGNHFTRALSYGPDSTLEQAALLLERLAAARLDQARSSAIAIIRRASGRPLTVSARAAR